VVFSAYFFSDLVYDESIRVTEILFFLNVRPPPSSTLFPYTTLFRSLWPAPTTMATRSLRRMSLHSRDRVLLQYFFVAGFVVDLRSEEHTSELQSRENLVCRLLLEKKKKEDKEQTKNS